VIIADQVLAEERGDLIQHLRALGYNNIAFACGFLVLHNSLLTAIRFVFAIYCGIVPICCQAINNKNLWLYSERI
jgi:hypothetical protein